MEKIISFCGIVCSECPAFLATKNNFSLEKKTEIAKKWSEKYRAGIKPEDINCEGCTPETGKKFNYCNVCEIRKCAQEKNVKNCGHCNEYVCEKLNNFFKVAPENKTALDEIKRKL